MRFFLQLLRQNGRIGSIYCGRTRSRFKFFCRFFWLFIMFLANANGGKGAISPVFI
jgi:hypothetical protein